MANASGKNELSLLDLLIDAAKANGFPVAGGVDLDLAMVAPPLSGRSFQEQLHRYDGWLAKGFAGEMTYLYRGRDRRADPRQVYPLTQSVFCVLSPYSAAPLGPPQDGPRYARYLRGKDYHEQIKGRLDQTLKEVQKLWPTLQWKTCVDTSAVLERTWAYLCGLGWIGKNTLLIHPQFGSYTFIGLALLSEQLHAPPTPMKDYCGNCERCLHACPTQALDHAGNLNARRCLSYWTLEKRGKLNLDDTQRMQLGDWVAGCDLCQESCPFNTKPARQACQSLPEDAPIYQMSWQALSEMTEQEYQAAVNPLALNRVKPEDFKRNLELIRRPGEHQS